MSLPGILTVPLEGENFPVVILVHGSGASDKDETIMQNKPFRDIAWGLAERGIASYRYDKSVFAYPENFQNNFEMTLYDETVNDAVEIFKMVKELEQINPDQVYILGHSLGGYAIPLIAEEVAANGYVIMAGNVRSIDELMIEQIDYLLNLDEIMTDDEQAYLDKFTIEIEKLNQMDTLKDDEIILGAYKAYWAFLKNYDPIEKADAIDKRVLVLQGERDYQVTMVDYELWHSEFENKNNWTFKTYESLNHLMMSGEGKPSNEEYMKAGTVSEEMIQDVAEWIKGIE
jgi:dienelactone hydrolase